MDAKELENVIHEQRRLIDAWSWGTSETGGSVPGGTEKM